MVIDHIVCADRREAAFLSSVDTSVERGRTQEGGEGREGGERHREVENRSNCVNGLGQIA